MLLKFTVFLGIVFIGGFIALTFVKIPAPHKEIRKEISVDVR